IKGSIVHNLLRRGVRLELHPCSASAEDLLAREPDAIFLANGPGDPAALDHIVATLRDLVGRRPTFGICLGHQLLCRAVGLETFKLPFAHRGANHPVKDLATGRVEITYSGVQACKVLLDEGYEVVLVNSNPATIMTDPEFATATYVEPLLPGAVAQVIAKDRPDALLPTLGGQTALNLARSLHDDGT